MQVDPDTVHLKVPWVDGPWGPRALGATLFVSAVANAVVDLRDPTTATLARTVAAGIAGLAWGLVIWLVDRWWDRRPEMHVVTEDFAHEAKRLAPAYVLWVLGALVFYRYGGGGNGLYGVTALLVMTATLLMLLVPTHTHRRLVRRHLRAGLVGPPAAEPT